MANANHKARPSRAERSRSITVTLRDTPDGYSLDTQPHPQRPFMPWQHIDRWIGGANIFKPGQRINVTVDYIRQSLTVTPEYDDEAIAREREVMAIKRKAERDELRKAWIAQVDRRAVRR